MVVSFTFRLFSDFLQMFQLLESRMSVPECNVHWCCLYCILMFLPGIQSYNLDTRFPILYEGLPNDYFGYSVGLLQNEDGYRALITAPRANSLVLPKIEEPGVLFSCDIPLSGDSSSCSEVTLDTAGNSISYGNSMNSDLFYHDKQDYMWLGVSLDIQQGTKNNKVVVCGHLWKNQISSVILYVNGVCYVLSSDLDPTKVNKLLPFIRRSSQISRYGKVFYGFAQVGMSAAFSEDGHFLFLGSPGFSDWCGTVLSYKLDQQMEVDALKNPVIPHESFCKDTMFKDYIGYSVTTGKFFTINATYSAVGAPRDGEKNGMVYIFQPLENNPSELVAFQRIEGVQYGGYFGASVSGIDVNGDGFTDLLVGAPLHSEESGGDEGRVHVYISDGMELRYAAELSGENVHDARFGTSIGNIGDLNLDGFNDVAIGAPYEDGRGAVYIYHGTSEGLNKQYVQRIRAKEISPMISGFGISISRGLDIDDNSYLDLLIGSHRSSNAYLFRAHPIIHVSSELEFHPPKINKDITVCEYEDDKLPCFNVTYCLHYTGRHAPPSLRFKILLLMDEDESALHRGFLLSNSSQTLSVSTKVQLNVGLKARCFHETAFVQKNIKDEKTPIKFILYYDLDSTVKPDLQNSSFCKDCPVFDPRTSTNVTNSIPFELDCGPDEICQADLVVQAYIVGNFKDGKLIIGQNNTLTLNVAVSNRGEPAYASILTVVLPPEVSLVKEDLCDTHNNELEQDDNNITLKCNLGSSIKKDNQVNVEIKIDIRRIPVTTHSLNVRFLATTVSNEVNEMDNRLDLPIFFQAMADIGIVGYQESKQISYSEEQIAIAYKYYVMNYGPSPVQKIDIDLRFPTAICGTDGWTDFIKFINVEANSGEISNIPAKCNNSDLGKALNAASDINNFTNKSSTRRSCSMSSAGKTFQILNCETAKCVTVLCSAGPFPPLHKSTKIRVSVQLELTDFITASMEFWKIIEFIAQGKISMSEANVIPDRHPDKTLVRTIIMGPSAPAQISKWMAFISIVLGILLLFIISVILFKIGFFKRHLKEKMESMMLGENDPILEEERSEAEEEEEETSCDNRFCNSPANIIDT